MALQDLRQAVQGEIFDYPMLMHHLREYKKPRDKVTQLLKDKSIIRLKKGVYIFGPNYQRNLICLEILANVIYSPSYVSLEYALSKYGLIPERAYAITSVSLKRSNTFKTDMGLFIYKVRTRSTYSIGINQVEVSPHGRYLIAGKEKALVDLISQAKDIQDVKEMQDYLYENMRMEKSELRKLSQKLLYEILESYKMSDILIKAIYD